MTGVALGLAVLPATAYLGVDPANPFTIGVWTIACAGAGLLADADHHSAAVAWSLPRLGPIAPSKWVCQIIGRLFGGHRNGTHAPVGCLFFVGVALFFLYSKSILIWAGLNPATALLTSQIMTGLWISFLFANATISLRLQPDVNKGLWSLLCIVGGVGLSMASLLGGVPLQIIPAAVAVGWVAHCLFGDLWTVQGLPSFAWPFSKSRWSLAPITTGTWPETKVVFPLVTLASIVLLVWRLWPTVDHWVMPALAALQP